MVSFFLVRSAPDAPNSVPRTRRGVDLRSQCSRFSHVGEREDDARGPGCQICGDAEFAVAREDQGITGSEGVKLERLQVRRSHRTRSSKHSAQTHGAEHEARMSVEESGCRAEIQFDCRERLISDFSEPGSQQPRW